MANEEDKEAFTADVEQHQESVSASEAEPNTSAKHAKDAETQVSADSSQAASDDIGIKPGESIHSKGVTVTMSEEDPSMVTIRTRQRKRGKRKSSSKRKKMPTGAKVALIVLAVIAILAIAGVITANVLISQGNEAMHEPAKTVAEESKTLTYKGQKYQFNENVVSILVLGLDDQSNYAEVTRKDAKCSDANMLVTMDTQTNKLNIIAIPRDSQVAVDLYEAGNYVSTRDLQLCLAYSTDCGSDDACARNSMKSVTRIFEGMPLEYYITLDEAALEDITTKIGGVPLTAMTSIPGTPIVEGEDVLLEGYNAWMYIKYRDINVDESAEHRLARQQQFMGALLDRIRGASAGDLIGLYQSAAGKMTTNLGPSEMSYLASCFVAGNALSPNITSLTGEVKLETDDDGIDREHLYLNEDVLKDTIVMAYYTPLGTGETSASSSAESGSEASAQASASSK